MKKIMKGFLVFLFVLAMGVCLKGPVTAQAAKKYVIQGETYASSKMKVRFNLKKKKVVISGYYGKASTAYGAFQNIKKRKKITLKLSANCKISGDLPKQSIYKLKAKELNQIAQQFYVKKGVVYKCVSPS